MRVVYLVQIFKFGALTLFSLGLLGLLRPGGIFLSPPCNFRTNVGHVKKLGRVVGNDDGTVKVLMTSSFSMTSSFLENALFR